MSLYLGARTAYSKAKIWLVSRTAWSTSFQDLNWVFTILYIKDKWDKHSKPKKTKPQKYIKLISKYKGILNRKIDAASKKINIDIVQLMAELLELIII